MLNSLLTRSGFQPIEGQAVEPNRVALQPRKRSWHQWAIARTLAALKPRPVGGIVPLADPAQAGRGKSLEEGQPRKPNGPPV